MGKHNRNQPRREARQRLKKMNETISDQVTRMCTTIFDQLRISTPDEKEVPSAVEEETEEEAADSGVKGLALMEHEVVFFCTGFIHQMKKEDPKINVKVGIRSSQRDGAVKQSDRLRDQIYASVGFVINAPNNAPPPVDFTKHPMVVQHLIDKINKNVAVALCRKCDEAGKTIPSCERCPGIKGCVLIPQFTWNCLTPHSVVFEVLFLYTPPTWVYNMEEAAEAVLDLSNAVDLVDIDSVLARPGGKAYFDFVVNLRQIRDFQFSARPLKLTERQACFVRHATALLLPRFFGVDYEVSGEAICKMLNYPHVNNLPNLAQMKAQRRDGKSVAISLVTAATVTALPDAVISILTTGLGDCDIIAKLVSKFIKQIDPTALIEDRSHEAGCSLLVRSRDGMEANIHIGLSSFVVKNTRPNLQPRIDLIMCECAARLLICNNANRPVTWAPFKKWNDESEIGRGLPFTGTDTSAPDADFSDEDE